MSATFATQLRANRRPIQLAEPGSGTITFRVQAADVWETVRITARPEMTVAEVKTSVVRDLFPGQDADRFVLKLRGWEVLDETEPLSRAGVVNGSILLLAVRRRRPVR